MKLLRKSAGILLAALFALATALAHGQSQTDAPSGSENHEPSSPDRHAGAVSYVEYPLQKLKKVVPALQGLLADPNQGRLSFVLSRVGQVIADLLPKMPNLISREDVFLLKGNLALANLIGTGEPLQDPETRLRQSRSIEFNYLILSHRTQDGSTALEEYRTDMKNRRIEPSAQGLVPRGYGFAYQWLLFSSADQPDFRFRYFGKQKIDRHETFAVAFAQIPENVKSPARFISNGNAVPFFLQGVVWIDAATFEIVLLRTDLLAPVPSVELERITTELHFRSVHIREFGAVLWLPKEVHITSEQGNDFAMELHRYSNYRLYHAQSRIVLTP
jgi:hypothetical protein